MIFVVKLRFHEERRSPVIIWLEIELRQCLYLSVRKLSNLLLHLFPFGSLFHGVFFSVDLFFRRTQISRRQKIQWSLLKYKLASYLTIILNYLLSAFLWPIFREEPLTLDVIRNSLGNQLWLTYNAKYSEM